MIRMHGVGVLMGALFFAFSLTPSLLPRPFLIQGLISGVSFSAGYGLGVWLGWLWSSLQLKMPKLIEEDLPLPERPEQTGSATSLISWDDLGRQGRRFVVGGPTGEDLTAFFGKPPSSPILVYVGLKRLQEPVKESAATP